MAPETDLDLDRLGRYACFWRGIGADAYEQWLEAAAADNGVTVEQIEASRLSYEAVLEPSVMTEPVALALPPVTPGLPVVQSASERLAHSIQRGMRFYE